MDSDHPDGALAIVARPLVIAMTPVDDRESLIGLVTRVTDENVYRRQGVILRAIGLHLHLPGMVGQEIAGREALLADTIGCSLDDVVARTHDYAAPLVDGASTKSNWMRPVRWGGGALERQHLDLRRRRVSPTALQNGNFHRADWLCSLLPYDPETLEPLVASCGNCGRPLGWEKTRGIGNCEYCNRPLEPSRAPALERRFAEDYLRFSNLLSVVEIERSAARETLAPDLQSLPPTDLTRLIIGLGRALDPWIKDYRRSTNVDREDPAIAIAVARGVEMLRDWPDRLRATLEEAARSPKGISRKEMTRRIRNIGGWRTAASVHDDVLRRAIPEAFATLRRSMCFTGEVALATEATATIGIKIERFRALERDEHIKGSLVSAGKRLLMQYPRERVEQIAAAWRGSSDPEPLAVWLGAPAYAVEQLAAEGRIEREKEPAVTALTSKLRVKSASERDLRKALVACLRDEPPPTGVISLSRASRGWGGREKNWASAFQAIADGIVPAWKEHGVRVDTFNRQGFAYAVSIDPDAAEELFGRPFATPSPAGFPNAAEVCQVDAVEILNICAGRLGRAGDQVPLKFRNAKRGAKMTDRALVTEYARETIAASELAMLLGQHPNLIHRVMTSNEGVSASAIGWTRQSVFDSWEELLDEIAALLSDPLSPGVTARALSQDQAEVAYRRLGASLACKA